MKYTIYADGLCEPNPGKASWGIVVCDDIGLITAQNGFMGDDNTNNTAEYRAVIEALVYAHEDDENEYLILTDSQLVVNQLNGLWQVKAEKLQPWYDNANDLLIDCPHIKIEWVKGSDNKADELTRTAYAEATGLYPHPRVKGEYSVKMTPYKPTAHVVDYDKIAF